MAVEYLLYALSAICMLAGLAGCILPMLPGPPLAYSAAGNTATADA